MSVEVRGLAEMVKDAKASIARAKCATTKLGDVAHDLNNTVAAVSLMTDQIGKAHAELRGEMAGSNIGPS
jgi:hypothetical protein